MTTEELVALSNRLCQASPDSAMLHREIASEPGGRKIASRLPGSSVSSHTLATDLAYTEKNGGVPKGFCNRLATRLEQELDRDL